jgi:hypothetical protein
MNICPREGVSDILTLEYGGEEKYFWYVHRCNVSKLSFG